MPKKFPSIRLFGAIRLMRNSGLYCPAMTKYLVKVLGYIYSKFFYSFPTKLMGFQNSNLNVCIGLGTIQVLRHQRDGWVGLANCWYLHADKVGWPKIKERYLSKEKTFHCMRRKKVNVFVDFFSDIFLYGTFCWALFSKLMNQS